MLEPKLINFIAKLGVNSLQAFAGIIVVNAIKPFFESGSVNEFKGFHYGEEQCYCIKCSDHNAWNAVA
jgi:hypothetical protein